MGPPPTRVEGRGQKINWLEVMHLCAMLTAMKRTFLSLWLLFCMVALPAYSIHPRQVEQPFDSTKELSKIDFSQSLAANQEEWVDNTSVSLLTVGPGDPLYAWFGHSALIVKQPSGTKIMYDWGIFDYEQEHFYLNFARGRMYYYVVASEAAWRIQEAIDEVRDVRLVELNLSREAKFALINFLQKHITNEYSTYLYHFYYDNCATRIRDIIDFATLGAFREWAEQEPGQGSYRQLTAQYMIHSPALFWVLDTLQSRIIDTRLNRYEELFLPEKLHQAVLDFSYPDGTRLAAEEQVLQDTAAMDVRFTVKDELVDYDWAYALFGFVFALLLFILGRKLPSLKRILLGLVFLGLGVLGSLLLFMMLFSDMDMTYFNENILFLNPLLFVIAFEFLVQKKQSSRLLAYCSVIMIVLLGLKFLAPAFALQDNLRTMAVLLPVYLLGSSFQGRRNRKDR
ncbi:MAG TPA: hypothetical protein DCR02_06250 [Sphaerochaeta sp.]|nr:hypothetical protein [Sphaerochaeta sp.]